MAEEQCRFPFPEEADAVYRLTRGAETAWEYRPDGSRMEAFTLPGGAVRYPGQGDALVWLPQSLPADVRVPCIAAAHGSGRCADAYRSVPFYARQRELALAAGYAFAVLSNGRDCWGTDAGVGNFRAFLRELPRRFPLTGEFGVWATSAGGVLTLRTVAEESAIRFVIGTFPVYDLCTEYELLASCRAAYGDVSRAEFFERIKEANPPALCERLRGCRYYITHGDADRAVPLAANSLRLAGDLGACVRLRIVPGGVHGTKDFSYYGENTARAFCENPAFWQTAGKQLKLHIRRADGSEEVRECAAVREA